MGNDDGRQPALGFDRAEAVHQRVRTRLAGWLERNHWPPAPADLIDERAIEAGHYPQFADPELPFDAVDRRARAGDRGCDEIDREARVDARLRVSDLRKAPGVGERPADRML